MNAPEIKRIAADLDRMLKCGAIPVIDEYVATAVRDLARAIVSEVPVEIYPEGERPGYCETQRFGEAVDDVISKGQNSTCRL